mmetsp:Transcript_145923/g.265846  ORF Transcript_145923/g.265846 Transcript_145923/m.265846 type:complete len:218 (-) Transcript_145923:1803-2456(-)
MSLSFPASHDKRESRARSFLFGPFAGRSFLLCRSVFRLCLRPCRQCSTCSYQRHSNLYKILGGYQSRTIRHTSVSGFNCVCMRHSHLPPNCTSSRATLSCLALKSALTSIKHSCGRLRQNVGQLLTSRIAQSEDAMAPRMRMQVEIGAHAASGGSVSEQFLLGQLNLRAWGRIFPASIQIMAVAVGSPVPKCNPIRVEHGHDDEDKMLPQFCSFVAA